MKGILLSTLLGLTVSCVLLYATAAGVYAGETYVPSKRGGFALLFTESPILFSSLMLFYGAFGSVLLYKGVGLFSHALLSLNGKIPKSVQKKSNLLIKALDLEAEGKVVEANEIYKQIGFDPRIKNDA